MMEKNNRKLGKAEKFSTLFDSNWIGNKSTMRTKFDEERSYDTMYSWEARSDNPKEFSRLQATDMPVQNTKPITMSGRQVILLDKGPGPEFLSSSSGVQVSDLPLTQQQKDIGMSNDLSGNIPLVEEARRTGKAVVLLEKAGYKNMDAQPALFGLEEYPAALLAAGPSCDRKLLNPAQRREILEFESKKKAADEYINSATASRDKLRVQATGMNFQRGIRGIDSCNNEESEIYGERARKERDEREYKDNIHLQRHGNLANKGSSMIMVGNILVPDSMPQNVKTEKSYQSKGGNTHAQSFQETHSRLFMRGDAPDEPERKQRLRDLDLGGKQYNLVTHAVVEQFPSRIFHHDCPKYMMHPSQTSLDGPRNLQGSLRPF